MPITSLYTHKRDRETLARMAVMPFGFDAHTHYQYTLDAVAPLGTNGITWDGANLWVCTDGNIPRGLSPRLVQLDPSRTGFANAPTQVVVTNLPAGYHLRDIAWHGAGFYGIVDADGLAYWLVDLDPTGSVNRVISTALLSSAQGIAWDGSSIYVTIAFTVVAFLQEWDPQTGLAMKVTSIQVGPSPPGTLGPGLLWDGAYFHTKVKGVPILGQIEYQVNWPDPGGGVLQRVHVGGGSGSPSLAAEKLTLAWDGAFMWSIAEII